MERKNTGEGTEGEEDDNKSEPRPRRDGSPAMSVVSAVLEWDPSADVGAMASTSSDGKTRDALNQPSQRRVLEGLSDSESDVVYGPKMYDLEGGKDPSRPGSRRSQHQKSKGCAYSTPSASPVPLNLHYSPVVPQSFNRNPTSSMQMEATSSGSRNIDTNSASKQDTSDEDNNDNVTEGRRTPGRAVSESSTDWEYDQEKNVATKSLSNWQTSGLTRSEIEYETRKKNGSSTSIASSVLMLQVETKLGSPDRGSPDHKRKKGKQPANSPEKSGETSELDQKVRKILNEQQARRKRRISEKKESISDPSTMCGLVKDYVELIDGDLSNENIQYDVLKKHRDYHLMKVWKQIATLESLNMQLLRVERARRKERAMELATRAARYEGRGEGDADFRSRPGKGDVGQAPADYHPRHGRGTEEAVENYRSGQGKGTEEAVANYRSGQGRGTEEAVANYRSGQGRGTEEASADYRSRQGTSAIDLSELNEPLSRALKHKIAEELMAVLKHHEELALAQSNRKEYSSDPVMASGSARMQADIPSNFHASSRGVSMPYLTSKNKQEPKEGESYRVASHREGGMVGRKKSSRSKPQGYFSDPVVDVADSEIDDGYYVDNRSGTTGFVGISCPVLKELISKITVPKELLKQRKPVSKKKSSSSSRRDSSPEYETEEDGYRSKASVKGSKARREAKGRSDRSRKDRDKENRKPTSEKPKPKKPPVGFFVPLFSDDDGTPRGSDENANSQRKGSKDGKGESGLYDIKGPMKIQDCLKANNPECYQSIKDRDKFILQRKIDRQIREESLLKEILASDIPVEDVEEYMTTYLKYCTPEQKNRTLHYLAMYEKNKSFQDGQRIISSKEMRERTARFLQFDFIEKQRKEAHERKKQAIRISQQKFSENLRKYQQLGKVNVPDQLKLGRIK